MTTSTTLLQENSPAPINIIIKNENNSPTSLKDYLQKSPIILYLYPKDNTSGCTKEACTFTLLKDEFEKLGYQIIGLSKDSPTSHQKFISKYNINFPLLSDEDHLLISELGAWQEKTLYGRKYFGTLRCTFIISQDGFIKKVFPKVTPDSHPEEIISYLKK